MKGYIRKSNMGGLLALLLFGIFAASILSVLLMGADAYRRLVERDLASYDRRTAAQYIATRVRQGDQTAAISVRDFDGLDTLVISDEINGTVYETRVYCYDGYLRELFSAAGGDPSPEDGEKILAAQGFEAELDPAAGLLHVRILNPDGDWSSLLLHPRSGEEVRS